MTNRPASIGDLAGRRLGVYQIESRIGVGGMGEVYRARDTKLGRDVAIKVIPPQLIADADRRARFDREARLLATLNHPHIAQVYGLEESDGLQALVMELVPGETLDKMIGPPLHALKLGEALALARQIADAVDAAHERGVIHRDLKPANIVVTPAGAVKVVDFGLAKAAAGDASGLDLSESPTITADRTRDGLIVGTPAYMSPEQARGKPVDKRSDIWAFGCVLYEMLTGRLAFRGETTSDTIAAILEREPDWTLLPSDTPDRLRALLADCLARDPKQRLRDIGDARIAIDRLLVPGPDDRGASSARPFRSPAPWRRAVPWAVAGIASAIAGWLLFSSAPSRPAAASSRTVRASLDPPENWRFFSVGTNAGPVVLSPDGRSIAFVASSPDGRTLLWVRRLDSLAPQVIAGTEGASRPFWSPDGLSLGFFADQKLKRVSLSGASVVQLADAPFGVGGAWSSAGMIVFGPTMRGPLLRVGDSGGTPTPATAHAAEAVTHRWPVFLPDGRRFLYLSNEEGPPSRWSVRAGSIDSTHSDFILEARSNVAYYDGYLLFVRDNTLLAQRFDPKDLKVTGEAVPLADQVRSDAVMSYSVFSVSGEGTLAYEIGAAGGGSRMVWLNRDGTELAVLGKPERHAYIWPQISRDGKRAAAAVTDGRGNRDIWIYEIGGGGARPLTFDRVADEGHPLWVSDDRIVFSSTRRGVRDLHSTAASGSGMQDVLLESGTDKFPQGVSPDGRYLIYATGSDLWLLSIADPRPARFIAAEGAQLFGQFSPDGRWLAYQSSERGAGEIYVTQFPSGKGKWLVSDQQGGILPRWRRDGREIFYLSRDHYTLHAAEVITSEDSFRVTRTNTLFPTQAVAGTGYPYDVSVDNRFLFVTRSGETSSPLTLVLNWTAGLKR